MTELKTDDAAPTACDDMFWLPAPSRPETWHSGKSGSDEGSRVVPAGSPNAGIIVDSVNDRDDLPFGRAGRRQALAFRVESLLLGARDLLGHELARERAHASGFNLLPAALAAGIALFYFAPTEPSLWALVATAMAFSSAAYALKGRGFATAAWFGAAVLSLGMLLAAAELHRRAMPVPRADITAEIQGIVLATDLNRRGAPRYLIQPLAIEGLKASELPRRIRVSGGSSNTNSATGSMVSGLARLRPLPAPYYPGGYDFAYHGWLDGLGLTGFFMGETTRDAIQPVVLNWQTRLEIFQNRIREKIAGRIRSGLAGQAGHVAVALITGDRSGLSEKTQENLRRSGLAHILAISGLHMALVTLTVIWLVRFVLVLVPGLAERHAIRKWAIGAGFTAATLYLFLAGAGVATQRAWIMLSVMMLAAMLDRQAITMRSVAIAALIVLAITPSSLFQPGFQMSFAAAAALVAAYRQWTEWQTRRERHWQSPGIARSMGGYLAGLTATSLIAGMATALFAAWHFHRIAPLGIAANLLAMPFVSLAVMPLCLLAVLLMPYGFEVLALKPLGWAIDIVLSISQWVINHHPGLETGLLPPQLPMLAAMGLVLLCCLRSRLRAAAVIPFALIGGVIATGHSIPAVPDLLIAQDGRAIAARQQASKAKGQGVALSLIHPKSNRFVTEIWRRAYMANGRFAGFSADGVCGKELCRFDAAGKRVSLVYDPDLLAAECNRADILLAPRLWFVRCSGNSPVLILTRGDLEQAGSHAIFIENGDIRTKTTWPSPSDIDAGTRQFAWQQRFDNVSRRFAGNSAE